MTTVYGKLFHTFTILLVKKYLFKSYVVYVCLICIDFLVFLWISLILVKTTVSCQTAEYSTMIDQRHRNFEGQSQQFWSSVLPGHLDLPIMPPAWQHGHRWRRWRRVETDEIGDHWLEVWGGKLVKTFVNEKTEREVYSFTFWLAIQILSQILYHFPAFFSIMRWDSVYHIWCCHLVNVYELMYATATQSH